MNVDSAFVSHSGVPVGPDMTFEPEVVFSTEISVPDAAWLRLRFGIADLAGTPGEDGAYLRVYSVEDGAYQHLDAEHLEQWRNSTAYFNGDAVYLELWAHPGTGMSRIRVDRVEAGEENRREKWEENLDGTGHDGPSNSANPICVGDDGRKPFNDRRIGRLDIGCTAFLMQRHNSSNVLLSAGHCWYDPTDPTQLDPPEVVSFNVPPSNKFGTWRWPGPENQYAINEEKFRYERNFPYRDYAGFTVYRNPNTGQLPGHFLDYGERFIRFQDMFPGWSHNRKVEQLGYGARNPRANQWVIPREWNSIQKLDSGRAITKDFYPWSSFFGPYHWQVDGLSSNSGDSGSPVLFSDRGDPFGILIRGGCTSGVSGSLNVVVQGFHDGVSPLHDWLNSVSSASAPLEHLDTSEGTGWPSSNWHKSEIISFSVATQQRSVVLYAMDLDLRRSGLSEPDVEEFDLELYMVGGPAADAHADPSRWNLVSTGRGIITDGRSYAVLDTPVGLAENQMYGIAVRVIGKQVYHRSYEFSGDPGDAIVKWPWYMTIYPGSAADSIDGPFIGLRGPHIRLGVRSPRTHSVLTNRRFLALGGSLGPVDSWQVVRGGEVYAVGMRLWQDIALRAVTLSLRERSGGSVDVGEGRVRVHQDAGGQPGEVISELVFDGLRGSDRAVWLATSPIVLDHGKSYWTTLWYPSESSLVVAEWGFREQYKKPKGSAVYLGTLKAEANGLMPFRSESRGPGVFRIVGEPYQGDELWARTHTSTAQFPYRLASGDINGNGLKDLVVANLGSNMSPPWYRISVLLNEGDGRFRVIPSVTAGRQPTAAVLADFSGNGRLDLAFCNYGDNSVTVLQGNGDGTFSGRRTYAVGLDPMDIAAVNRGGSTYDLFVANSGNNTVSVLRNNGFGEFIIFPSLPVGVRPVAIATGDLRGDGGMHAIAVANSASNTVSVFLQSPAEIVRRTYATGHGPTALAIADIDGDGHLDMAVANRWSGRVSLFRNTGSGEFNVQQSVVVGDQPAGIVLADLSGNGRTDIATVNRGNNTISMLRHQIGFVFERQRVYQAGNQPVAVIAGDFAANGCTDLAVANSLANTIAVYHSPCTENICEADLNNDGVVDVQDLLLFIDLFAEGDPSVDFNDDGFVDVEDFFLFLQFFDNGC